MDEQAPVTPEKKQRKARTPDDYVVQVSTPEGQWADIKHDLKDTEDGKKFVRVAIPAEFDQFVGRPLRVIAVKWTGKVEVVSSVKGKLTD